MYADIKVVVEQAGTTSGCPGKSWEATEF